MIISRRHKLVGLLYDTTFIPQFPLTGEAVLAWLSFFVPGRTFAVFAVRLEKACRLVGLETEWRGKADATAILGRPNARY